MIRVSWKPFAVSRTITPPKAALSDCSSPIDAVHAEQGPGNSQEKVCGASELETMISGTYHDPGHRRAAENITSSSGALEAHHVQ